MLGKAVLGHSVLVVTALAALEALGGWAVGIQVLDKLLVVERLLLSIWVALMLKLKIAQKVPNKSRRFRHLEFFFPAFLVGASFVLVALIALITI